MATLRAGFGRRDITPKVGCQLVGYANRLSAATGIHDPLLARALVLDDETTRCAILSADLCYLNARTVQAIRKAVHHRTEIPPSNVFIATTHTHSGPHDGDAENWERPLPELFAEAVAQACEALQPARLGGGYGVLYGYSINRRWLDRPVDPGVAVVRVDNVDGTPLGLLTNFACHGVVLGYDSFLISADWPGYACREMEHALGPGTTCLFLQGGSGDINPLVEGVRMRLQSGHAVMTMSNVSYYGPPDDPQSWHIGDRKGGTFEEAEQLGEALAREVLRVARGIRTTVPTTALWSEQITINAARGPEEPQPEVGFDFRIKERPEISEEHPPIPAEIMLLGVDGMLLFGQPGEVLSQTAVTLKTKLCTMGYSTPMIVSYANGWLAYLPDPIAFEEGGYEASWPKCLGISRYFQDRVWQTVEPLLRKRTPAPSLGSAAS